jgi:hypothetical protein
VPRLTHPLAEWIAVARELGAPDRAACPPGLSERVRTLVERAPGGWPDELYALELDDAGAAAIVAVHAELSARDPDAWQRAASVAEADAVVRAHQRRSGRGSGDRVDDDQTM